MFNYFVSYSYTDSRVDYNRSLFGSQTIEVDHEIKTNKDLKELVEVVGKSMDPGAYHMSNITILCITKL